MFIIHSSEFIKSGTNMSHFPEDLKREYLMLGRSNVGKSSLINGLLNRKNLARTSGEPGKTVTLNFFLINDDFYLVDAPGYGYARRSKSQIEEFGVMIEEYLSKRENLSAVFLLIDFKVGPTKDDIIMYQYLRHFKKDIYVVATKIDKANQSERAKGEKIIRTLFDDPTLKLILTSSQKKFGFNKIYQIFEEDTHE
ncbi:MAG: ribosome biogenesis GTP-binding protein YihA/YsxC [Paracholeplasma sp.]|jgi:GTP-binding protein|nr:ribosome biogenesis GTP-binding protein YihA/YsxC [Paracholeplasma sp.]MDY3196174.1 ribosome biogenesis GTP-binding protein YihA/YsxC [Paracholeplasma sp.]